MLCQGDQRSDALLVEEREQLVHADEWSIRAGNRIEVPVQRVDHHQPYVLALDEVPDPVRELPGRADAWLDLFHHQMPGGDSLRGVHAECVAAGQERGSSLVEQEHRGFRGRIGGAAQILCGDRRFPGAGRSDEQRGRAPGEAAAEQRIELRKAAFHGRRRARAGAVGDELGENRETAAYDDEIVETLRDGGATKLHHAKPPSCTTVLEGKVLEEDDAVRQAPKLQVRVARGVIVEQQDGRGLLREELLQAEDLPPIPQRLSGQQPQLRQGIEHDAGRPGRADVLQHRLRQIGELDLCRVIQRVLVRHPLADRRQLKHFDAVEAPAMRGGGMVQFLGRLGQSDVQAAFASAAALEQELHRERRLAGARLTFDQVQPSARQAAVQELIQAGDAGRGPLPRLVWRHNPSNDAPMRRARVYRRRGGGPRTFG